MANVVKYDADLTMNVPVASGAISEGLLYGINSSGNPVLADRHTGPQEASGFAAKGLSAADGNTGQKQVALSVEGVVDLSSDTAHIAGAAFTQGARVYLDTAGGYTTTKPSTAADIYQAVGVALTTTKVYVHIHAPLTLQVAGNSNIGI